MAKPKHRIVIEIDEEGKNVIVNDTVDGIEASFQSVAVFAGDAVSQEVFIRMYGSGADAAWAFGQGFRASRVSAAGKALRNFYKQAAAWMCQIIDPGAFRREEGAEELINKWESTDQSKWGGWDSEDVLEDKQKSEERKRRAEELGIKLVGPEGIAGVDKDTKGPTFH